MDEHNSTVWQGYVAAVASLSQALLFVMAIMTISLMQIAALIGEKPSSHLPRNQKQAGADAQANAGGASGRSPESAQERMSEKPVGRARAAQPEGKATSSDLKAANAEAKVPGDRGRGAERGNLRVVREPSPATGPRPIFRVVFVGDADTMEPEQRRLLVEAARKVARTPQKWRIWVSADPALKRAAYIRVLEVRRALISAGVDLNNIDLALQLEEGVGAKEMTVNVGRVESSTQAAPAEATTGRQP